MATPEQINDLVALYAGYFNRAPDPEGLQFWIDQIDGGREFNTIAADFAASEEATALYPYLTTPDVATPSTFITSIYQNLFNRAPEPEGLQFWTDVLESGAVSAADMIESIINGAIDAPDATPPTFDATTLENKIEVGRDFAEDAANTSGFEFDAEAKSAAIAAIDGVTNDEATVVDAKAATDAYLSGEANEGDTFTLTTGADILVGTAANDTFNALSVNATGANATTFSAFDSIDGGAGKDTLNIFAGSDGALLFPQALNGGFPTSAAVKNVETVNINNTTAANNFGAVDASKFEGATQIWQAAFANNVSNLAATTTAGLRNVNGNVTVAPAAGAAAAAIALENFGEGRTLTVNGSAATSTLAGVTVSGTVKDTNSNGTTAATTLAVSAGKDVETLTVDTAVKTTLTVTENAASAASKDVRTVDASASTGGVTFGGTVAGGTAGSVATIMGGSGDDTLTIATATVKDNAATAADETVAALVEGGAGKDNVTINTTGTGATTVNAGEGDDMVSLTADGSGKLSVDLGAGDDSFKGAGTVSGTDMIDGGAGTDSLLLNMVGSANIGAFTNFEVFDAAGLAKTLDVDILASKNTVTEFTASADVGAGATLTNVGAGVGYRVTGDTIAANAMTLTQKTAGALTVTLDIDEPATTAANVDSGAATNVDAAVVATNATSINAVFDSSFKDEAVDNSDNLTNLTIQGDKATSLDVVSGGENAINDLAYVYGKGATTVNADGLLTGVTVSGSQALSLSFSDGTNDVETNIATVDASALTGSLSIGLDDLKATGVVTLGSGDDAVTAQAGAASTGVIAAHRVLNGIEKGTAEDATIQSDFDVVKLTGAVQAADQAATATLTVKDGLLTFNGAGPATLQDAVNLAAGQLGANEAVVFEFIGDSFIYAEGVNDGGTDDVLIKLDDMVGLTGLDDVNNAGTNLYVF